MRIHQRVEAVFNAAYTEARLRKHEYLTPEHVLYAALKFPEILVFFEELGVDTKELHKEAESFFENKLKKVENADPSQTIGFQTVLERAVLQTRSAGRDELNLAAILVSLYDEEDNYCSFWLRKAGLERLSLLQALTSNGPNLDKLADLQAEQYDPSRIGKEERLQLKEILEKKGINEIAGLEEKEKSFKEEEERAQEEEDDEEDEDIEEGGEEDDAKSPRTILHRRRLTALERFSINLTALARKGKIEPFIGREEELERTIQVLCRRRKNNPIHVGDPGVGKTSLMGGLALRLIQGEVPPLLKDHSIYSLDIGLLVAGTRFRGDFEERLKRVLAELLRKEKTILYIDEIHTLVGAGSGGSGALDGSSILKPALNMGLLRCVGSTTHEEYRRFFEKDRGLARRFQKIDISEPSPELTFDILKGLRSRFEDWHRVTYSDQVLEEAVRLSSRFILERRQPDKAIDIMDEAGARLAISFYGGSVKEMEADKEQIKDKKSSKGKIAEKTDVEREDKEKGKKESKKDESSSKEMVYKQDKEVFILDASDLEDSSSETPDISGASDSSEVSLEEKKARPSVGMELIEEVIASIARIPRRSVVGDEREQLRDLEENLKGQVFGQDLAIEGLAKAVKRSRAGFRAPGKPVANLLFVGPTGVGKTELARQLATVLNLPLHRFDMSEYQEKHSVSRLIGSPPGYVGYEEGGLLSEAVRKNPHAVLLLDEIEKAHADIYNILLQIMDYATLTDNSGRKADFRNIILIMTSNAGARELGKQPIGFDRVPFSGKVVDDAVERLFTPEFRNRLDAIVPFSALDIESVEDIVRKTLKAFASQLAEKNITLSVSPKAERELAEQGYSLEFGARNVERLIETEIKTFFVDEVLFGRLANGGEAKVDYIEGAFSIEVVEGEDEKDKEKKQQKRGKTKRKRPENVSSK